MSGSVTVGFSPASAPISGTTGAPASGSAPTGDAGETGLFAELLALLVPQLQSVLTPSSTDATPPALADSTADALAEPAEPSGDLTAAGDSADPLAGLFAQLSSTLVALREAIAAGEPPGPGLEQKLADGLDALAALLSTPGPTVPTDDAVPSPLAQLGTLLGGIADGLEATAPALADKLGALANRLGTGDISPEMRERLLATADDGEADSLVDLLLQRLMAPAGRRASAETAQPAFSTPALPAPDAAAAADTATPPATATATAAARPLAGPAPAPDAPAASPADTAIAPASDATTATGDAAADVLASGLATAAGGVRAASAAYQAQAPLINLPAMAVEIVRQFEAGNTRFQIRLDPPELGRIDVRLELDRHGTVHARMIVERPETLDLMQRDQRALQQALQQAGLDQSRTNLEFSLRQNPFGGGGGGHADDQPHFHPVGDAAPTDAPAAPPAVTLYRATASASGLNLFV